MLKSLRTILSGTIDAWLHDEAPRLSAALAFYTILSLAPLAVLVPQIVNSVGGRSVSQTQIINEVGNVIGPDGAKAVREMIEATKRPAGGTLASIMSVITLLFGASAVFGELRSAMNKMWDVQSKENGGFVRLIRDRFFSFGIVLAVGFLLVVSLAVSTVLSELSAFLVETIPIGKAVVRVVDFVVSFGGMSILFALIFKYLPETDVQWKDVRLGSIATAFLFTIGKILIGVYLGNAGVGEAYGGGGSLIVVLVWVYYSSMIFFFGAEFTRVIARPMPGLSPGFRR